MESRPDLTDAVLIIDFGSQVTQLIARRVRESGVYCEIHPYQNAAEAFAKLKPRAVILSGGPASVTEAGSPRAPDVVFSSGVPVLGICYGQQAMAEQLGGKVESGAAGSDMTEISSLRPPLRPIDLSHHGQFNHHDFRRGRRCQNHGLKPDARLDLLCLGDIALRRLVLAERAHGQARIDVRL